MKMHTGWYIVIFGSDGITLRSVIRSYQFSPSLAFIAEIVIATIYCADIPDAMFRHCFYYPHSVDEETDTRRV